jgi:hypothetical protein
MLVHLFGESERGSARRHSDRMLSASSGIILFKELTHVGLVGEPLIAPPIIKQTGDVCWVSALAP